MALELPELTKAELARALPHARHEARALWNRCAAFCGRSIGVEDLEQEAIVALWRAAQRWRSAYHTQLWTFARRGVRTAIVRILRRLLREQSLPLRLLEAAAETDAVTVPDHDARLDLRRALQAEPACSLAVVAERLGFGAQRPARPAWTVDELARALRVTPRRVTALLVSGAIEGERVRRPAGGYVWSIPDHAAVDAVSSRRRER